MKILVDADACPVKEIVVRLARRSGVPVVMLADTSHVISDGYSEVITVDKGGESVDVALINLAGKGDIVVTQDFGVAAMALGAGAAAVNQNGMVFSSDNMDMLLFERHMGKKARRAGKKTAAVPKRSKADDDNFEKSFKNLLNGA